MAATRLLPEQTTAGLSEDAWSRVITLLAAAEILRAGVAVTLQGIRIIYEPDGSLLVHAAPRFRHPDGYLLPAVILPPELAGAIATEVLNVFQDAFD